MIQVFLKHVKPIVHVILLSCFLNLAEVRKYNKVYPEEITIIQTQKKTFQFRIEGLFCTGKGIFIIPCLQAINDN